MTKAVPYGHACGQRAEEILTCQNLIDVEAQEHAPVGAPSCCVSIGEAAVQRRSLEEILDSGSECRRRTVHWDIFFLWC